MYFHAADYIEPAEEDRAQHAAPATTAPRRSHATRGVRRTAQTVHARPAAAPQGVQLLEEVAAVVAGILESLVPPDQPLMEAGLDSLGVTLPPFFLIICNRAQQ